MTPTRIYVIADAIRNNARTGRHDPPIVIRHADGTTSYAHEVEIHGDSAVVYSPDGLPDDTHVWVETTAPVTSRQTG
jgi:hypothetical protein